tara:strand:- start:218 stop:379 length:162 start_codon:yes stop_codon:yes gene_type:complete
MTDEQKTILQFCNIQLEILKQREVKLRKDILDCRIQKEFLLSTIEQITKEELV